VKAKKENAFLQRASESLGAARWLQGNLSQLYEEGSKEAKSLAIFEAELSAIQAALAAFAQGSKIGGPILGGIWAAVAFAFGQDQVMKMQNVKKAAKGMVLRGPSHAQGGIPVEAEGDEIIMTKGVYRDPVGRYLASELNYAFGGIRFMEAGGPPINPLGAQQVAAQIPAVTGGSTPQAYNEMITEFRAMRAEVSNWQRNLKVYNVVTETRDGINTINNLEQDAGF
jgi:hypothetical protein